ncbi:transglycosylase SLT domain-containing protein [Amycolatopsis sp., V23-08]|uniref:Transglycosylase SLT domain-containing protein n=1 Tax=Amycolatopsis heterodermiae TaxID=3110235 RepID=A0ABU5RAH7_9PSEU|nr:transglycosylase SLT domain-containing protein [Amycolatopsis sp., V23-08]MEA5363271.1 transglycosylase SLT domain-containing protein [Amycolatopsis sp., V23-08]
MTKLSAEQIARHAYDAGFRGQGLTTAVAVALAESGGRTTAHNATPPDNSYGLWQINMLGALGPDRRHQYHLKSNDALFDPDTNARVAKDISSDGHDFTPWSTYTNGAYKDHLAAARKAAQDVTKHHGKPQSAGTSSGALRVDDAVLHAYVKRTHGVADALGGAGGHLGDVRDIAGDSFGRIGKESGFADALAGFGLALQKQVKGVGTHATGLATAAQKAAKSYRDHETATAAALDEHARRS